jgi:hypothetical protein
MHTADHVSAFIYMHGCDYGPPDGRLPGLTTIYSQTRVYVFPSQYSRYRVLGDTLTVNRDLLSNSGPSAWSFGLRLAGCFMWSVRCW